MEIGPISGIRALPVVKTPPTDPHLSANFEIVHSEGPGDDTYSGEGRKASHGQDDEDDELELIEEETDESRQQAAVHPESAGSIDYFA